MAEPVGHLLPLACHPFFRNDYSLKPGWPPERYGLTPLYLSREDIWNAAAMLREVAATQAWRAPGYQSRDG